MHDAWMIFIGEPFRRSQTGIPIWRPLRDKDPERILPDIFGSRSPNPDFGWPISQFSLPIPELAFAFGNFGAFFAIARRRLRHATPREEITPRGYSP
jgi:hypothetical protein